jgi:hypothetical protein
MVYTAGFRDAARGPSWWTGSILGPKIRAFHAAVSPASTAWPVANTAFIYPFLVPTPVTFAEMFWVSGTGPGTANIDLGIYRDDFTLISSIGATASVNTTDAVLPAGGKAFTVGTVTLPRGRYYMGMSAAATSITVRAAVNTNDFCRALGMFKMATAHPLPATFTPASMGTTAFIPTIGATTITNIL